MSYCRFDQLLVWCYDDGSRLIWCCGDDELVIWCCADFQLLVQDCANNQLLVWGCANDQRMVRNCANDQLTVGSRGTDPRGNGRLQGEAEAGHVLLRRAGLLPGQWPFLSYLTATPAEQYIRGRYRAPSVINPKQNGPWTTPVQNGHWNFVSLSGVGTCSVLRCSSSPPSLISIFKNM